MKEKMKKVNITLLIIILLLLLFSVSVGTIVISTVSKYDGKFNIFGGYPGSDSDSDSDSGSDKTSDIEKVTWDVHFENVSVNKKSVQAIIPAKLNAKKTSVNFEVYLEKPGDFYEFSVDIVNSGKMDAKVTAKPVLSGVPDEYKEYFKYTVKYSDGTAIKKDDELNAGKRKIIVVRVEFDKENGVGLVTDAKTFNLGFSVDYVQK